MELGTMFRPQALENLIIVPRKKIHTHISKSNIENHMPLFIFTQLQVYIKPCGTFAKQWVAATFAASG